MNINRFLWSAIAVVLGLSAFGCSLENPLGVNCGGTNGDYVIMLSSGIVCSKENSSSDDCKSFIDELNTRTCPDEYYCHDNAKEPVQEVTKRGVSQYCSLTPNCEGDTHYNSSTGACDADSIEACGAVGKNCKEEHKDWAEIACVDRQCVLVSCVDGKHIKDGTCVSDTLYKCGQNEDDCSIKGQICLNGKCDKDINCSYTLCDGFCIDTTKSNDHCGVCNNACTGDLLCLNSKCGCTEDKTQCGDLCTILDSDNDNCGSCGNQCGSGRTCDKGKCRIDVGGTFNFGSYEQDNNTANGKEPISWIILDYNEAGQALVISELALDVKQYHKVSESVTWEKCTLRSWLNGYGASSNIQGQNYTSDSFISSAFTNEEQAKIIQTTVTAEKNPRNSALNPGNNTNDKIFLLSLSEAKQYFTKQKKSKADSTLYVIKHGASVLGSESHGAYTDDGSCADTHCYSSWWLRTSGDSSRSAATVGREGSVNKTGQFIESIIFTVRPAMWVTI